MMTIDVPTLNLGSPRQISAATKLRQQYIQKLVDRGFNQEDIQNLITVRCIAKWWLDNSSKLGVMDAVKHFSAVTKLIQKYGTAENAADSLIEIAYQKEKATAEYIYNSTPMYKL